MSAVPTTDGSRPAATVANARVLVDAWREGATLPGLPHPIATLDEAYRVQTEFVRGIGPVGGWKVSPLRPGDPPRCSPIPGAFIRTASPAGDERVSVDSLVEIEIAVRLGSDLHPRGGGVTREAVAAAIATVHPAIEIVASRFDAGAEAPDLDRVADLQTCGGVLLGEGRRDWRAPDFADHAAELINAGRTERSGVPQPSTDRTLDAVAWLAAHAAGRGLPLAAGQTLITGARLGPLRIGARGDVIARLGTVGEIRLRCGEA